MIFDISLTKNNAIPFGPNRRCYMELETTSVTVSQKIQSIAKNNGWQTVGPKRRNKKPKSPTLSNSVSNNKTSQPVQIRENQQTFDVKNSVSTLPIDGEGQGVTHGESIVYVKIL